MCNVNREEAKRAARPQVRDVWQIDGNNQTPHRRQRLPTITPTGFSERTRSAPGLAAGSPTRYIALGDPEAAAPWATDH